MGSDTRWFYKQKVWQHARDAYLSSVGGLCEVCLSRGNYVPAEIIHHRNHITPENVTDPNITLNWGNLQALCRQCHADAHEDYYQGISKKQKRYKVDENGNVILLE